MEHIPNRKERRKLAKDAGYLKLKTKASYKTKMEMIKRAGEYGKQIHFHNVENNLRKLEDSLIEKDQITINDALNSGKSDSEALKTIIK